jgi:hypothetical protein
MERRKAITTAAAASLTLLAGAAGIAVNSSIVSASGDDPVGKLSPVGAEVRTPTTLVYVDRAAPVAGVPAPAVQRAQTTPVTTSAASPRASADDHEDEFEHDGREEEEDREEEDARDAEDTRDEEEHDAEHEYEGADDDD